jgi:alcohol dehydrogenase class IV
MVEPFNFTRLPLILFRKGKISDLPDVLSRYGPNILLVTGKESFQKSVRWVDLIAVFNERGIEFNHIIISGEPTPEMIDDSVWVYSNAKPDVVVAIGGGSVIDAGKAISAMIPMNTPVIDYLEGIGNKTHPGTKIPFIAVPTTSGTGSEATKNAVISRIGNDGFKKSLRHDNFVPDIAFVDPELTLTCPENLTAACGMDCFTQLTEAYLSDKSNEYTDALALEGLRVLKSSLLRCFKNGRDIEARTGMSFAALTSGICLANAGLGVVHGFASSIGARYNIPHGVICGTLMAAANELNVKKLRKSTGDPAALKKYALLGELFTGKKDKGNDNNIDVFIEYLHHLTDELKLPGLKKSGVNENDLETICASTECKNNPVKLNSEDLMEIILSCYI